MSVIANVDERVVARRARVAGCDVDARDARALRDLPRKRVLPAAAADDEDVHTLTDRRDLSPRGRGLG